MVEIKATMDMYNELKYCSSKCLNQIQAITVFYTCHTSKEKKDGRNQSYHEHV